jgi:hypothetical protein
LKTYEHVNYVYELIGKIDGNSNNSSNICWRYGETPSVCSLNLFLIKK